MVSVVSNDSLEHLTKKYTNLLRSTSKLIYRVKKQAKSRKDLNKTVKYLKTLYFLKNKDQIKNLAPVDPAKMTVELLESIDQHQEVAELSSDDELLYKKSFVVEEDRIARVLKKRIKNGEVEPLRRYSSKISTKKTTLN